MKIFQLFITTSFIFAGLTSCKKLLNEPPKSFLTQGDYYSNQNQAISGVNGIYSVLTNPSIYGQIYQFSSIPTDLGETCQKFQPCETILSSMWNHTYNSSTNLFQNTWQALYQGINYANLAISKIPLINMNSSEKTGLIAQARFLRALYYFDLIRWFGHIPLDTNYTSNITNLDVPQANPVDVYNLIKSDLEMASGNLPLTYGTQDVGRATKGAVLTLLGEVYLTEKDWSDAASTFNEVINLNVYSLFPQYMDLWQPSNANGQEFIFEVQYQAGVINSPMSSDFAPRSSGIQASQSAGEVAPTPFLMSLYSPGDQRLQMFKDHYVLYNSTDIAYFGHPFCFKYFDLAVGGNSGIDFPVMRYADVLLMYSEALCEENGPTPEAYWGINMVRRRAFGEDVTSPTPQSHDLTTGLTKEQFLDSLYDERARELCFEGHRWFDLVRTGTLVSQLAKIGKTIPAADTLYPIPQYEMDNNKKLIQNPGY